ncbi:MAG: hypothetical protein RL711_283 [Bacteroidota bacterium]|jgi:hypothetical protein
MEFLYYVCSTLNTHPMLKFYKSLVLALLIVLSDQIVAQNKVIGYSTSWAGNEEEIQYDKLTHLNFAFIFPNTDGSISELEDAEKLRRIVEKAHAQEVKVFISVAGWNLGSESKEDGLWETVAENGKSRKLFVKQLMHFVSNYHLDGVDIYWTYPLSTHASNSYLSLMTELNHQLTAKGKGLSAVVAPIGEMAENFPKEVFALVDHLNILSYESKDSASFGYDFAHQSLNYWIMKGLSKEKAIVGIPFHTKYAWDSYENIVARGASPFDCYHRGEQYNGLNQVLAKTELAKGSAGGVMIWEVTHDVEGSHSLLTAIDQIKKGVLASHHINTLSNVKAPIAPHKEVLLERVLVVDSIDAATNQTVKKVIQKD